MPFAERGEAAPDGDGSGTANARIHLIEHQGVGRLGQYQAQGQHGTGEFATAGDSR